MPNAERRAPETLQAGHGELTPPPLRFDRLALFLDLDGVLAPLAETTSAKGASRGTLAGGAWLSPIHSRTLCRLMPRAPPG